MRDFKKTWIMQSIFKRFWCHACKSDLVQPENLVNCAFCRSELVEEVEADSEHPSMFVPQGIRPQNPIIIVRRSVFINFLNESSDPGASETQINSLETIENSIADCTICQEKIEKTSKRMPCKHEFHEQCLIPWLKLKNSCPVCRTSVSN